MPKQPSQSESAQEAHINVAFCFDLVRPDYLIYTLTTLVSLFENNKSNRLRVYIVSRDLGANGKKEIEKMAANYAQELVFISEFTQEQLKLIEQLHATGLRHRFEGTSLLPAACYYRLLLPFLVSEERLLYLDAADIIVCEDLCELYNTDFDGCLVCGVSDLWLGAPTHTKDSAAFDDDEVCKVHPDWLSERENLSPEALACYINSGVMLWNLAAIDRSEYLECLRRTTSVRLTTADQSAINVMFRGRIKNIGEKYNFMLDYKRPYAAHMKRRDQHLVHYTKQSFREHPWGRTTYFYRLYYHYLDKTRYAGFRHRPKAALQKAIRLLLPKRRRQAMPPKSL